MSHSAMSTPLISAETKPSEPSELKLAYSLCQRYSMRVGSSPIEQRPEPAGRGGDDGAVRPGRDLADAVDALVGVDAEEDPRVARAGQVIGRDVR